MFPEGPCIYISFIAVMGLGPGPSTSGSTVWELLSLPWGKWERLKVAPWRQQSKGPATEPRFGAVFFGENLSGRKPLSSIYRLASALLAAKLSTCEEVSPRRHVQRRLGGYKYI